ncbi:MAG TPA: methyltransferase [Thermoanaerobaculia bacterium]|nr:methyltransferase [Thermoanaerobaculia bacterium]
MLTRRAFALLRTLIVAPAFVSLWMYFVPKWIIGGHAFENARPLGWFVVAIGAVIGLPCVWQFAWRGLGTPAPFDPPRRLVISGPYRWVRNPMYIGMGIAVLGEGVVYPNITGLMLAMVAAMFVFVSLFVIGYEEPTLRRTFGADYENY